MLKSHKLRPIYSFFRPNVRGLKEKLLSKFAFRISFLTEERARSFSRDRKLPQLPKNHENKKAESSHSIRGVSIDGFCNSRAGCGRPPGFCRFSEVLYASFLQDEFRWAALSAERCNNEDWTMPLSRERCYFEDRKEPLSRERCYFENRM